MKSLKRGLKALLITALAYLIQVCVLRHLPIAGVTGSIIFAALAVLTVSCGKKYAFCSSCMTGMVMECMLSPVPALYAVAYPVIAMLGAQVFADMTDRQLERRRMANENHRSRLAETGAKERRLSRLFWQFREGDLPAHLRILLCAMMMDAIMNVVMCVYMYLIGEQMTLLHLMRILISVLYTGGLTAAIMVPLRFYLNMYPNLHRRERGGEAQ